ncbi:MAG: general secretion pathway protein GspK [Deltaproteobacteria bacterium]|nr:general secretion pathway protein GspK [Deltaproteobacteria bacterium]
MKKISNNRGIALLITLSIITLLVATTLELHRRVRSALLASDSDKGRFILGQITTSGIHAGMAMLVKDKAESDIDSIQEDWADKETIDALLLDLPFENGAPAVTISDELGKIQVNALVKFPGGREFNEAQRNMWEHFLNLAISPMERTEDTEPTAIINSIKDWLDSGDDDATTGLSGAESDYYMDLEEAYPSRNGPLAHLGELGMIKGITPELFQGAGGVPGIGKYMTVFGISEAADNQFTFKGRININTADHPVIAAILPVEHEFLAQAIFEYREELSDDKFIHDLSGTAWYKNAPGCSDVDIDPGLIMNTSDTFRITSEAAFADMKMTISAVVQRVRIEKTGQWYCKILSWQEK